MKHSWPITLFLTTLFLLAQLIGVGTAAYAYQTTGSKDVAEPTGVGERPETTGLGSILFLLIGIGISTAAILFLAKSNLTWVWHGWFFLASFVALYLFFSVYVANLVAAGLALTLAALRNWYKHIITHNIVELLMYAGIALFLAPLFTVNAAAVLLLIMSIYDAYAVWRSQHMVTLANFTRDTNNFPGLNLAPGGSSKPSKQPKDEEKTVKGGVLGGGDILFPLLFSVTVFFAGVSQTTVLAAIGYALITTVFAAIGLLSLFIISRENAYYPALPFLTVGCYVGLILVRTIHTF